MLKQGFIALLVWVGLFNSAAAQHIFQVTDSISWHIGAATMSGDGSRIFYFRKIAPNVVNPPLTGNLYMVEVGSSVPKLLLEAVRIDWLISNRTGSRLLYGIGEVRYPDPEAGWSQIFSLNVDTGKVLKLTDFRFFTCSRSLNVALAEEAEKIFVASCRGAIGIFEIPWEGGEPKKVADFSTVLSLAADAEGQTLYYSSFGASGGSLFRLDVQTGGQQQLAAVANSSILKIFATPDQDSVVFSSQNTVLRYDRRTGRTETLFRGSVLLLASMSGDGRWVLLESDDNPTGENPDRSAELFLVSTDGNVVRQITRHQGGRILAGLELLPKLSQDASSVMVVSTQRLTAPSREYDGSGDWLYRILPSTADVQLLDFARIHGNRSPMTLADNIHFIFDASPVGLDRRFVVSRNDGSHFRYLAGLALTNIHRYTWSSDGEVLAFVRNTELGVYTVFVYRTKERKTIEVGKARWRPSGSPHDYPSSPIYGLALDGTGENLVISSSERLQPEDSGTRGSYLYAASLKNNIVSVKFLGEGYSAVISYNGRLIAFESNFSAQSEIFVMPVDASEHRDPPLAGRIGRGRGPQLSSNGEWLVFIRDDQIVLARADGSFEKDLVPGMRFSSAQISADGQIIAGLHINPGVPLFAAYDREGNEIAKLDLPETEPIFSWSLTPAGKEILFATRAKLLNNQDGNEEIFAARLVPFEYSVPEALSDRDSFTGIALTNLNQEPARVLLAARNRNGSFIVGPVSRTLSAGQQIAALIPEILGPEMLHKAATVEISSDKKIEGFFVIGSSDSFQGAALSELASSNWFFPLNNSWAFESSSLVLFNPNREFATVRVGLDYPVFSRFRTVVIPPVSTAEVDVLRELLSPSSSLTQPLLEISSSLPLRAELRLTRAGEGGKSAVSIPPLEVTLASDSLLLPHVLGAGLYQTRIWIANPGDQPVEIELEVFDSRGQSPGARDRPRKTVGPRQMLDLPLEGLDSSAGGYVKITSLTAGGRIGAAALVSHNNDSLFLVDATRPLRRKNVFPYIVQDQNFFTGYSVVNSYDFPVRYTLSFFDAAGKKTGATTVWVGAQEKHAELLSNFLKQDQVGGYFVVEADWPLTVLSLIGTASGSSLANLPAR